MAYPEALVLILIWHFRTKCLRIGALVKAFHRCIKAFLASGIRKSVLEELTFAKLAFGKSDFLNLVNFAMVDGFSILLPPSAPPATTSTS